MTLRIVVYFAGSKSCNKYVPGPLNGTGAYRSGIIGIKTDDPQRAKISVRRGTERRRCQATSVTLSRTHSIVTLRGCFIEKCVGLWGSRACLSRPVFVFRNKRGPFYEILTFTRHVFWFVGVNTILSVPDKYIVQ